MMRRHMAWIALAVAVVVMLGVVTVSAGVWRSIGGSEISLTGWLAMGLGVLFSLGLGIGLMALVFFSNRHGYDDQGRDGRE
jgi:divalent metal cation (Fe/Co/Zn/Cd) transporter